ncbi:uncharacterized protein K441DRAFT_663061, partial [Cenococcum geophilum 1.58]|uniref:uncharacterized protein n=1 Tax=Cenococcum geophilum 1.58 TaxID=794803 RepID=UPI00358F0529
LVYFTTVLPTCTPLPYVPTRPSRPIRLRNDPDNPSCRYAYDPESLASYCCPEHVACIVLLPEPDKPRAIRLRARTRLGRSLAP